MKKFRQRVAYWWRGGFVLIAAVLPLSLIGRVTARAPVFRPVEAVSLSGVHFKSITKLPQEQRLANALVQTVGARTPNVGLNAAIADSIQAKTQAFTAALPATPAVSGFFHQLRVVSRVDYSAADRVSITLETDEYHPLGTVTTRFESWLADGKTVSRPVLTAALAEQLAKALRVPAKKLLAGIDSPLAMGLLPNYKLRLYASGPLEGLVAFPYTDIPMVPEAALQYHASFYPTYPERFSAEAQARLNREFNRSLARDARPADCQQESCLALTFDDGPDPTLTPKVLTILSDHSVNATFFELGNQIQKSPDVVKRIAAAGNEIENHSFNHPDFVKLHAPALIRQQIDQTSGALAGLGVRAKFLRPPYGSVDDNVKNTANMPLILWNVDAQEWRTGTTPQSMAASIDAQARPGAIILMHDTKAITVDALPIVLDQLTARGFRFVTVAQLLQIDGNARGAYASK